MGDMGRMMDQMMGQSQAAAGPDWLLPASWLLVALGVALLLTWAVRYAVRDNAVRENRSRRPAGTLADTTEDTTDAPLMIAQRRYARGEIGREEYEQIRGDLLRDGSDPSGDGKGQHAAERWSPAGAALADPGASAPVGTTRVGTNSWAAATERR